MLPQSHVQSMIGTQSGEGSAIRKRATAHRRRGSSTSGTVDKKAKLQETSAQSLQQKDKLIAVVGAAINGLSNVLLSGVTLDPAIFSEEIKATIENSLNHLAKVVSSQGIGQSGSSGSTMEHEFTASPSPISTEHLDGSRGTTAEIADQPETLLVENESGMEQNDNPDADVTLQPLQAQAVKSAENIEQVEADNIPRNDGVVNEAEQIDNNGEIEVENIAVEVPHDDGVVCCSERNLMFEIANLICANDNQKCRVKPGDKYQFNAQKNKVFCLECFSNAKEDDKKDCEERMHKKSEFEIVLTCTCERKWHKVCARYIGNNKKFVCQQCSKDKNLPIPKYTTAKENLATTALTDILEVVVNGALGLKGKELVYFREMGSAEAKKALKTLVPSLHHDDFKEIYNETIDYVKRALFAFQEREGGEVSFCAMYIQEYQDFANKKGNNIIILHYLDTAPHSSPSGGRLSGTIMNYTLFHASRTGIRFTQIELWAQPPLQGDDYVFHNHPSEQMYKTASQLVDWYKNCLQIGVTKGLFESVTMFGDKFPNGIQSPLELDMFVDGPFEIMLQWADRARKSVENSNKGTVLQKRERLMSHLEPYIKELKSTYFYIIPNNKEIELLPASPFIQRTFVENRKDFLYKCMYKHWQWSSLRTAIHATSEMVNHYCEKLDQGKAKAVKWNDAVPTTRRTRGQKAEENNSSVPSTSSS